MTYWLKGAGVVLILAGLISLLHDDFTYTKETHDARLGSLEFQIQEHEQVHIPAWAGAAGILAGGALLLVPGRRTHPV